MKHPQPIQISIPNPCHEDWNKMTPREQGRFCDSCQKCVVDFTGFSDAELLRFHNRHKNESVCGQYRKDQLNRPVYVPKTRAAYYNWFVGLGFIVFLSELLGTDAKAQAPATEQQADTTKTKPVLKGDTLVNNDIEKLPTRNANDMVRAGVSQELPYVQDTSAISIRGTRATETVYIIDGVQVRKWSFMRRMWYRLTHPFAKKH